MSQCMGVGSSHRDPFASQVHRLAEMAAALRQGGSFPVTRLTMLKKLCQDARGGTRFLVHLAAAASDQMRREQRRRSQERSRQQRLALSAVSSMRRYLARPSEQGSERLFELLRQIYREQDTYESTPRGALRVITNPSLLVVEHALRGVLSPTELPQWAYRAARQFAERYDSRFPSGLVPKSAPLVEEMADFWCRHLFRRPLRKWLASAQEERRSSVARRVPRTKRDAPAAAVDGGYPSLWRWVTQRGWIEVGPTEGSRSFLRALDDGGMVWEGTAWYASLQAALEALEDALARWFAEN
jgi:hypothetical protein